MDYAPKFSTILNYGAVIYLSFVILFCWNSPAVAAEQDIYQELILTKNEKIIFDKVNHNFD